MRDDSAVGTLDERAFEDAVRWLHEQYRFDRAVLRAWRPGDRSGAAGSGPWAVREVASQAARLEVAVDAVRRTHSAGVEVQQVLVDELNRLLGRYRARRGFRRWRDPEG